MPDFLRPAVYPVLLVCIVGSLWMLGSAGDPYDRMSYLDQSINYSAAEHRLAILDDGPEVDRFVRIDVEAGHQ